MGYPMIYRYIVCANVPNERLYRRIRPNLVGVFIYIDTMCLQAAKALRCLCICADTPEPSLLIDAITTEISCTGPIRDSVPLSECNLFLKLAFLD